MEESNDNNNWILHLKNLRQGDVGTYSCEVNNVVGRG